YQPKIDLKTMSVCGAEALIRLCHPTKGIILPAQFLPPTTDPLYAPLTRFIVRRSMADWNLLSAKGISIKLAINVPASILQGDQFVAELRNHLPQSTKFPG